MILLILYNELNAKLFTDDTNLFILITNQSLLNSIANEAMSNLNSWLIANRLSLNSHVIITVFSPRRHGSNVDFSLHLNGTMTDKVENRRYLEIITVNRLKWSEHIEHIYCSLLKYVGIRYKLRTITKCITNCLLSYCSFIHSTWNWSICQYFCYISCQINQINK